MALHAQVRYKNHMRKTWLVLLFGLAALAAWAQESGPPTLPPLTAKTLLDFDSLPDRNVTFVVDEKRTAVYNLVQPLLQELDYAPTANLEHRGDLLGPLISERRYRGHQLAEIVAVRLLDSAGGAEITIRGLYISIENAFVLDQSGRRATYAVQHFPELYKAKKALLAQTSYVSVFDLLEHAHANLNTGADLEKTQQQLQLAEQATLAGTQAGRQTRELLAAVDAELSRRQNLRQTTTRLREKIRQSIEQRDWLSTWLAADELLHVLLTGQTPRTDPAFAEAVAAQERARRELARRGRLAAFPPQWGPGENNEIVVGFAVLNVSNRPVSAFDTIVDLLDGDGERVPGRHPGARTMHIKPPQPIAPGQTFDVVVAVAFDAPAHPAQAVVRVMHAAR